MKTHCDILWRITPENAVMVHELWRLMPMSQYSLRMYYMRHKPVIQHLLCIYWGGLLPNTQHSQDLYFCRLIAVTQQTMGCVLWTVHVCNPALIINIV